MFPFDDFITVAIYGVLWNQKPCAVSGLFVSRADSKPGLFALDINDAVHVRETHIN